MTQVSPYRTPAATVGEPDEPTGRYFASGEFVVSRCVSDAWRSTWRNLGPWVGLIALAFAVSVGVLLASFAVSLSLAFAASDGFTAPNTPTVQLLGIVLPSALAVLFILPLISSGLLRFSLNAIDSRASAGDLFDLWVGGGSRGLRVIGWMGALILIALPAQIFSVILVVWFGDSPLSTGIGTGIAMLWGLLIQLRFYLSGFYLIDADRRVLDALRSSWRATRKSKLASVSLALLNLPIMLLGVLALIVGVIPATLMSLQLWASAYRQVEGSPTSPADP